MHTFNRQLEDDLARQANAAAECIRYLNHHTLGLAIPGPVAYRIVANLAQLGHMLPQALDQLAAGLDQSLTSFEISEDTGADPVDNVNLAMCDLYQARAHARKVGYFLDKTQSAISGQSYR